MATVHIRSKLDEIAEVVLMPGDPLRAKVIADNYLEDVILVNDVRNNLGYTGFYKGKRVTVFASGMGVPSIGIYAYELIKFYNVKKIIRIGSCGSNNKDIKLLDVILATGAYSLNPYAKLMFNKDKKETFSSEIVNNKIEEVAKKLNIDLVKGTVITSDIFDVYIDYDKFIANFPSDINFIASEMEAFCLFLLGEELGCDTTALLTVVDSKYDDNEVSVEVREKALDEMILLALESCL